MGFLRVGTLGAGVPGSGTPLWVLILFNAVEAGDTAWLPGNLAFFEQEAHSS